MKFINATKYIFSIILQNTIQFLLFLFKQLFSFSPNSLNLFLGVIADQENTCITYHKRPQYSDDVSTTSYPWPNQKKLAIILQGPVIKENDFTIETIKIYIKHFPDDLIILSTWNDEDTVYLTKCPTKGVKIIFNKKPDYSGNQNINYQIASTYAGVIEAKENNFEYILKTRTDQRLYSPDSKEFLFNILDNFPIDNGYNQKSRIIGVSLNTFKFRPYGLSDMTLFGQIDDMIRYWGVKHDLRKPEDFLISYMSCKSPKMRDFMRLKLCEIYLFTNFLESLGRDIKWTLADSWDAFACHTCIIDKESLDLYWPKYQKFREFRYLEYSGATMKDELSFHDWLSLFSRKGNIEPVFEEIIEKTNVDTIDFDLLTSSSSRLY